MLELLPRNLEDWGAMPNASGLRWRRCGQDGVLELMFSRMQWLHYKLKHSNVRSIKAEKEHLLVESSLIACHYSFLKGTPAVQDTSTLPVTTLPRARASTCRSKGHSIRPHARKARRFSRRSKCASMASHGGSSSRSSPVAFPWHSTLAFAATWIAILALPLSQCEVVQGLAIAGGIYVVTKDLASQALEDGPESDDPSSTLRMSFLSRSHWIRAGIFGRSSDGQHSFGPQHEGSKGGDPQRSYVGSPEGSSEDCPVRQTGRGHSFHCWPSWWTPYLEWRFGEACNFASSAGGREGYCGDVEAKDSWATCSSDVNLEEQGWKIEGFTGCRCHEVCTTQSSKIGGNFRSSSAPISIYRRSSGLGGSSHEELGESGEKVSRVLPADDDKHAVVAQGEDGNTKLLDNGNSAKSSLLRGRRGHAAAEDGRVEPRGDPAAQCRVLRGAEGRVDCKSRSRVCSEKPHGLGRPAVKDEIGCLVASKIKPGVRQMISQAWDKHCRDRLAMSKGRYEIYEVMEALHGQELREQMNETFALEVDFPDPFITEVYTDTEPVAKEARRRGLRSGQSLTLSTSWDFFLEEHRQAAKLVVEQTAPYVLVLAFPCGPWSLLMNLNVKVDVAAIRAAARVLVVFAVELAFLQLLGGRHFIMENPLTSMAWQLDEMKQLLSEPSVHKVVIDQCYFGLMNERGELHRKATQLVTSSQVLVSKMLGCRCRGGHAHAPVIGGAKVTRPAGHYPRALASAMVSAMQDQFDFETKSLYVPDEPYEAMAVEEMDDQAYALDSAAPWQSSDDEVAAGFEGDDEKLKISSGVRQMVFRLHENTGHRSGKRLARALMVCGAPKEAILAAKQLRCPVCAEQRAPRARRPATLPQTSQVGAKVHIDLLMLDDALRQSYVVVHATDSVSRFQMAAVLDDKSSASVVRFLSTHWVPLMGPPETLVADQGREFISQEFEEWTSSRSIYLYHVGVQCPWQNGVAERSGGTLKALVGAVVRGQAIIGVDEMAMAVGEAVAAYNSDVNEEGISPLQAVTGRQPVPPGDVLAGVSNRLAEHSKIENEPWAAKQMASRELARIAMVRLHFSRGLRKAELARARSTTFKDLPQPGDLCYYWREVKYNPKKERGITRRKLTLKRWHGPALMVAIEGQANCFLSHRGQLTKCGLEHVRKASALEQISAGAWEEAIREVIEAVPTPDVDEGGDGVPVTEDAALLEQPELTMDEAAAAVLPLAAPPSAPLTPGEVAAVLQPSSVQQESRAGSLPSMSRRSSKATLGGVFPVEEEPTSTAAPGTPVPELIRQASDVSPELSLLQQPLERARALERMPRGEKRPASQPLDDEAGRPRIGGVDEPSSSAAMASDAQPSFEALVLSWDQLCNLADSTTEVHPLLRLQAQADLDKKDPTQFREVDHGSWDGRWSMLCEREWELQRELCQQLPCGSDFSEVLNVQASRKEYSWNKMSPEDRKLWSAAAVKGWQVYIDNEAVQVLSVQRSIDVRRELAQQGRLGSILRPRFVLTDKADGLRTLDNDIPKQPSARLVVPGFRDSANLEGKLRRDAPTGSRLAQHLLFCLAAWNTHWSLISGDVKSAFLKGDPYVDRILYITATDEKMSPPIPLAPGQLAMVRKGVFGLADAPRQWWLRLCRAAKEHSWEQTIVDGAAWLFWHVSSDGVRKLDGIMVSHVDDLLFSGGPHALSSFEAIGKELGFGSQEESDFVWCGKRIRRAEDGTIRLSMVEYHKNLKEIYVARSRKTDPTAPLTAAEAKQLRALLGSLQWLVAQLRFDCSFLVSTLQGERPVIGAILRANAALKQFQQDPFYEMVFRPVDPSSAGVMVVADAALGNVTLAGGVEGEITEKVYSQACYFVLLADSQLMSGSVGTFNVLDSRSHRIPRVCRSTYAAETLSTEEAFDVGRLCRGLVATAHGKNLYGKPADVAMDSIPMQVVVDAKDVYDKTNSDTPSYGAQKSLAFTVAWMRAELRRPNTTLRWTSTENMWVDGGTKLMDLSHMRRILSTGKWSVSYSPSFVKQVYKAARAKPKINDGCKAAGSEAGEAMKSDDAMTRHLMKLGEQRGWHSINNLGINVAYNAKSYRGPEPRFSAAQLPLRSTFVRVDHGSGQCEWRRLESGVRYSEYPNQHALIGFVAPVLVTLFHSEEEFML